MLFWTLFAVFAAGVVFLTFFKISPHQSTTTYIRAQHRRMLFIEALNGVWGVVGVLLIAGYLFGADALEWLGSHMGLLFIGLPLAALMRYFVVTKSLGRYLEISLNTTVTNKLYAISDDSFLHDQIKRLSEKAGIVTPHLRCKINSNLNAYAIALKSNGLIIVTSELLRTMNQRELEAILAHEMGHIKHNHALGKLRFDVVKTAVFIFGIVATISAASVYGWFASVLAFFTAYVFYGFIFGALVACFSRAMERACDAESIALTGSGYGLIRAFEDNFQDEPQSTWLEHKMLRILATHPRYKKRVQALKALTLYRFQQGKFSA